MDVARHEYGQFEQITFVLVIDLSKRIAIAPFESQDKQLIFQHCAQLFNEWPFFALLDSNAGCLRIQENKTFGPSIEDFEFETFVVPASSIVACYDTPQAAFVDSTTAKHL